MASCIVDDAACSWMDDVAGNQTRRPVNGTVVHTTAPTHEYTYIHIHVSIYNPFLTSMASRMGVILADHCASVRSYTSSESPDTSVDVSESDTV